MTDPRAAVQSLLELARKRLGAALEAPATAANVYQVTDLQARVAALQHVMLILE